MLVEFIETWIVNIFVVSVKDPWPHLISSYHMGVSYSQLIPSVKGIATTIQSFLLVEKYVEILVVMLKVTASEERGLGSSQKKECTRIELLSV